MMTLGTAELDHPETDPHSVSTNALHELANRCDQQLTLWGAPDFGDLPEEVLANGFAEFRIGGKTASDVFPNAPTAALARATCEGTADDVNRAITDGGRPSEVGLDGATPLAWAIACENLSNIAALLAGGANPNQHISGLGSPVVVAAGYRNSEILRLLLAHGGDPNGEGAHETALITAYDMGRQGAGWVNFEVLLEAGADVNRRSPDGDTLADRAAMYRDYERVLTLLNAGYSGDLVRLGRDVSLDEENLEGILPEVHPWIRRVKQALQQRGVRFPVPPLMELERDGRGFYVQH